MHPHEHHPEPLEIAVDRLAECNLELIRILSKVIRPAHEGQKVHLVFKTTSINNSILQIMALNLNANQFSIDSLGLIDSDTGGAVVATFANPTFTSDNPAVFTTTADPSNPNQTKDVAVAAGSANLTATADATYTDSKTGQSVTKSLTVTVPVTVVAIVAGENVALVINQGAPQQQ